MKNTTIKFFAFLLAAGLTLTFSTNAPAQSSQSTQGSGMGTTSGASTPVEGTAVTVDPVSGTIIITELSSGSDQTFTASQDDLRDIQPGDQVTVTPDQNDSSKAEKVEKK